MTSAARGSRAGLQLRSISRVYGRGRFGRTALYPLSQQVASGSTLAVVGESGAGKSTLVRLASGLERPSQGEVLVGGVPQRIRAGRKSAVQVVFQNPVEALSPRLSIGASVEEALTRQPRGASRDIADQFLERVGLDPSRRHERPARFSGGQLQRVAIARALVAEPDVLLCDEPTSALDVSVQGQIINLLLQLQTDNGFACVIVTHDLGVARVLADDIMVLRQGHVDEVGSAEQFFQAPRSPYGSRLLELATNTSLTAPLR